MILDIKRECPDCGKILDGVIETNGNDTNLPRPGDYTVCLGCYAFLEFTETSFKKLDFDSIKNKEAKRELSLAVKRIKQWKDLTSHLN